MGERVFQPRPGLARRTGRGEESIGTSEVRSEQTLGVRAPPASASLSMTWCEQDQSTQRASIQVAPLRPCSNARTDESPSGARLQRAPCGHGDL